MMETHLAPGLLLAMPQLMDPNFSRAVVLMIEHNDEGSFGLIINHPIELTAVELLDSMDMQWNGDPEALVWSGGPVQPNSGWILYEPPPDAIIESTSPEPGGTFLIQPGLALCSSPEALREIAAEPPAHIRIVLGYSGWGPGQLAMEMARGSWLHADLDPELVFETPAETMWNRALRSLGIDPETVVQSFGIH